MSGVDKESAQRIASVVNLAADGKRTEFEAAARQINELAKDRMRKWEKKEFEETQWKKLGGEPINKVVHGRDFYLGQKKKNEKRSLNRHLEAVNSGLDAKNPLKAKRQKMRELMYEKKKMSALGKGLKINAVGKEDRSGILRIRQRDVYNQYKRAQASKKGDLKLHKMLKKG